MLTKNELLKQYESNILPGPLNGVIILGLCYYVSGPMALQNLVTQGALVIKIEGKPIGDPSRYVFSKSVFNSMSHNQLSIVLDTKNENDQRLLEGLLGIADAIVDNRSIRAKKSDTILQNHLLNTNKKTSQVYCSINGFPNAEVNTDPGLDASIQAATGLAYTNCSSPEKPLKVGIPILDQVAGLLAAHYVVSNLYFLLKTPSLPKEFKKVIYISVSMAGASMWLQTGQVINVVDGEEFFRSGNKDRFAVPFSFYTTKNGLISIATVNEDQFKRFCIQVLENEEFHNTYPNIKVRIKNQDQFEMDLNELLKNNTKEFWYDRCKKYDLPASPVFTVSEAINQNFAKTLLNSSVNGRPVITHGIEHSFFNTLKKTMPAPSLDQHHASLSKLFESNNFIQNTMSKL